MQREMASINPDGAGRRMAISARRGYVLGVLVKETVQVAHRDQRGLHVQQFLWVEHAAVGSQVHLLADVVCAADGQVAGDEQRARLAGLGQADKRLVVVGCRLEAACQVCRGGEIAKICQAVEDLGVFKDVQGFGIHTGEFNHKMRD